MSAVTVLVGNPGVDFGLYIDPRSIKFTRPLNGRGTAAFTMNIPAVTSPPTITFPEVGANIAIFDGGDGVFGGSIEDIAYKRLGNAIGGYTVDVNCVSNERKLDKAYVGAVTYKNMTAGAIALALISTFAVGESIGTGTVSDGATIDKIVYNFNMRLSEALDDLAKRSNFIWYLSTGSEFNFIARDTVAAPFDLMPTDIQRNVSPPTIRRSRADFRSRQHIRVSFAAFTPEIETFAGDGTTQAFDLSGLVDRIELINVSTNTKASVSGTFSAPPADGDVIDISGVDYTFVAALDNFTPRQVLIGATADECADNFHAAVNDTGVGKGTTYSLPTTPHPTCETTTPVGPTLSARFRISGTFGNGAPVSTTSATFAWADTTMSGAADGTDEAQDFGAYLIDTGKPWYYSYGETTINQDATGTPLAVGQFLEVSYRVLGHDIMSVQDDAVIATRAAVEGTSGIYENLIDDSQNVDAVGELAKATAILDTYKTIPFVVEGVETRLAGLLPGMLVTLTGVDKPQISGDYLIDNIDGYYVPSETHFRYRMRLIDSTRIGTWLQFWENLAAKGKGPSNTVISAGATGPGGDSAGVWSQAAAAPISY